MGQRFHFHAARENVEHFVGSVPRRQVVAKNEAAWGLCRMPSKSHRPAGLVWIGGSAQQHMIGTGGDSRMKASSSSGVPASCRNPGGFWLCALRRDHHTEAHTEQVLLLQ